MIHRREWLHYIVWRIKQIFKKRKFFIERK
jgi:hypothetical protein